MTAPVTDRAATAAEVVEIVGRLDDVVIADIVATGASPAEVLEAWTWMNADDYMGGDLERPRTHKVARVLAILEAQLPDPDEPGGPDAA
ncbi:MAG: hypothetical protein RID91_09565 [Azospirillaceae bacterium]